ncbi:MAG: T9SS type A sorting domain-containing protein [Ignavibacteria bacterium]|nr:T9SS type A sorting domain-containing protein [Ignavibacteria bacterium]
MKLWFRCIAYAVTIVIIGFEIGTGQSLPKREFRGAWIATVTNLDWPPSLYRTSLAGELQRTDMINLLDQLHALGINAVIFQVRTECDALYNSPYEPWSYWLTGEQGVAPSPLYDPLAFVVAEAHKRGMEVHAWFNPYRAERVVGNYPLHSTHITRLNPGWAIQIGTFKFLNPALAEVRNHVAKVIADVVRRYDVEGVHMDDYFYPYSPNSITHQDTADFNRDKRGFSNIADWRRDNVNLLIKQIYDSVQAIRPVVKFGMSPFGIWKNNVPVGISGTSGYDALYADATAWLSGRYIDYITPQLYWPFGGGQDYNLLQTWWSQQLNGRHFYTGNATYRLNPGESSAFASASEISNQIRFNRNAQNSHGSIQFRAKSITANFRNFADTLTNDLFRHPSIVAVMDWKERVIPFPPRNIRVEADPVTKLSTLKWDTPFVAPDGDTASRYAVYRFTKSNPGTGDLDVSRNILALTGINGRTPDARIDTPNVSYSYAVTALDRNNNESIPSNLVSIASPVTAPLLASPSNGEQNFPRQGTVRWNRVSSALTYQLQIAGNASFSPGSLIGTYNTADSSVVPGGFLAQETYYWRVVAGSQGGASPYSPVWSFKTGWPKAPLLVAPGFIMNADRFPTFVWTKSGGTSFRLKIVDHATNAVQIDTTVNDTVATTRRGLEPGKIYRWQVLATNAYGSSDWSEEGRFRVDPLAFVEKLEGVPSTYQLAQNYPNPFNAATTIQFAVPESGLVSLRIYDILGREVATLIDDELPPGIYARQFYADDFPSGPYVYVLSAGRNRIAKKMLLVK